VVVVGRTAAGRGPLTAEEDVAEGFHARQ
jgi:hypothetical protein